MSEVNRYFSGTAAYAGHNKVKRDHTGNVSGLAASNAVYALPGNALASSSATTYQSPVSSACQKNFVIFLSNGKANVNNNNDLATTHLSAAGGSTTTISLSPSGNQSDITDEWARYLANKTSNPVITYVIDVVPTVSGQYSNDYKALLQSMAKQGNGTYFNVGSAGAADLGAKIKAALDTIFSEIQAVDSAFASASLPVSVNSQGTYLNQVFIGMFRPESKPRWFGNLKQYQFRANVDAAGEVVSVVLADKTNTPVINPLNGFITSCAKSYWSSADTYWPVGYLGSCTGSNVRSNLPDGEVVEKGAAAQKLRALPISGTGTRNVKTCSACSTPGALVDLSTTTASIAALGVADATAQSALVNWSRGTNVDDELSMGTAVMRPSVHGDVVHSRPLAIDYGGTTGVVVYYGGNDGMLRGINGNKPDTAGNELWSFVAPEHFGKLKRLKSNSPIVSFPGFSTVPPAPAPSPKDYFFDGPIGVHRSGSSVWIYPTMRRGGSSVYAFDVSAPASPTLKWVRDGTQLTNIGQTWSEPKVTKVSGYGSGNSPLIIMGGGYDSCEDQDAAPNTACTTPKGNQVFVLDANDGTLKATLATDRSVAADVTLVDSNGDGRVDVAYAVDTGANLYRINIGAAAPGSWTIKKIASLGCSSAAACSRKFLHAPEVVVQPGFNAVLVGSGNRERPLITNQAINVDNAFFMIKDDRTAIQALITTSALVSIDPDTALTTTQKDQLALSTNKGWYLALGTGDHDKEQVVTSAVVVAGVTYFSTHMPTVPNACEANLGTARGYAVNFLDASTPNDGSRSVKFRGGGLPPSPVAGVASINPTNEDGTAQTNSDGTLRTVNLPFIIGGGGVSGIDPSLVNVNPSGVRSRVFWYIQR